MEIPTRAASPSPRRSWIIRSLWRPPGSNPCMAAPANAASNGDTKAANGCPIALSDSNPSRESAAPPAQVTRKSPVNSSSKSALAKAKPMNRSRSCRTASGFLSTMPPPQSGRLAIFGDSRGPTSYTLWFIYLTSSSTHALYPAFGVGLAISAAFPMIAAAEKSEVPVSDKNSITLKDELVAVARKAGAVILEIYNRDFETLRKADRSPVTEADTAAEAVILEALARLTPD